MKKFLRTGALLLCICLLALPCALAFDVVEQSDSFYVADYADVLLPETEAYIVAYNNSLASQTGAQLVVVTLDFLDGTDIEDYSTQLFNEWGIGDAEKNNGLLVLLAVGEQEYWATQGSGLSTAMTSSLLGDYLYNYLETDFAAAQYDAGVKKLFDALMGWYGRYYNVQLSQQETVITAPEGMETLPPSTQDDPFVEDKRTSAYTIGDAIGTAFIVILVLAIVIALLVTVPRTVYLRRRGYHYSVFNRAFWSARHRPPPPRPFAPPPPPPGRGFAPRRAPRRAAPPPPPPPPPPSHGGFGAGPGLGGSRPGGFGAGPGLGGSRPAPRPAPRPSSRPAPRPSSRPGGFGGASRGGGAGRSSSIGRSAGGFSRSNFSSGARGGGGSTRGGGAGRRGR